MRVLCVVLLAFGLAGCEQPGRYQIAMASNVSGVFRLDTKTGEITVCGAYDGRRITCKDDLLK